MNHLVVTLMIACISMNVYADKIYLSRKEAEQRVLQNSLLVKASNNDVVTAQNQEDAGLTLLYPRLSFRGSYSYALTLPEVAIGGPNTQPVVFGDHNNYSIGPTLSYTLWDNGASLRNHESLKKLKESAQEISTQTKMQMLMAVRMAYIKAQLAFEEKEVCHGFLKMAKEQEKEVMTREKEGAATKIDVIVASRQSLSRNLQCKQAESASQMAVKDLIALLGDNLSPVNDDDWQEIELESLESSLRFYQDVLTTKPEDTHPQIRGQELVAQATQMNAMAEKAKLFPRLEMQISANLAYPNGPQLINHFQNSVGLSLTVPLFLGDPTTDLVKQKESQARSIRFRARQMKADLERDYEKAFVLVKSLKEQKQIALRDVVEAKKMAAHYYDSYKAGRIKIIDVSVANNEAMSSSIQGSRINAQILQQIAALITISGKEFLQ